MRNASEYDVYIPLTYNDGAPVDTDKIANLKKRLQDGSSGEEGEYTDHVDAA